MNTLFNSIEDALEDIKAGKFVIVVDDEDRENEGDFICAAEKITPEIINFMATHGRGLICTPIDEKRADELELNMMVFFFLVILLYFSFRFVSILFDIFLSFSPLISCLNHDDSNFIDFQDTHKKYCYYL